MHKTTKDDLVHLSQIGHHIVDNHQKGGNRSAETRSSDCLCHANHVLHLGSLGPAYSDFN